ncbi:MAG: sulfite dehydrogenase [Candidatus Eutrophobiaceae bacterium]
MTDSPVAQPHLPLEYCAGNGLLDRRLFMQGSLSAALLSLGFNGLATTAQAARSPGMNVPGRSFSFYGQPSQHEDDVSRFPTANPAVPGNGVSWTPLHKMEGTITPNGLHYERHHNGVPDINPEQHRLLIHGMTQRALTFSIDQLMRYPLVSKICFLECGGNSNASWNRLPIRSEAGYFHGMASNAEWTGVPLALLLDEAGLDKKAKWLIAEGADAFAMHISIPIEKAMDDALLALYQNGERIRPENGYPLRLLLPGWEGVLSVKWLRRLKAVRTPIMARNETARYTELLPNGKARQFTFTMEAKSLITSPSSSMVLRQQGIYPVTGLAWSGRGRIKRVEVSADGGKTWADAELQKPVLPKAFTRFRIPWHWHGQEAILQSRASDETGYIQPDRKTLIAARGSKGFFHYNAIVSWAVDTDGVVSHTYGAEDVPIKGEVDIDSGWH